MHVNVPPVQIAIIDRKIQPYFRVALECRIARQEPLLRVGRRRERCDIGRRHRLIDLVRQQLELSRRGMRTARRGFQILAERRPVVEKLLLLAVVHDADPQLPGTRKREVEQLPFLHPVRFDLAIHDVREPVRFRAELKQRLSLSRRRARRLLRQLPHRFQRGVERRRRHDHIRVCGCRDERQRHNRCASACPADAKARARPSPRKPQDAEDRERRANRGKADDSIAPDAPLVRDSALECDVILAAIRRHAAEGLVPGI